MAMKVLAFCTPFFFDGGLPTVEKERGKSLEEKTKRIIIVVYFWPELTANLLAADI